jgi:hypothetical protein
MSLVCLVVDCWLLEESPAERFRNSNASASACRIQPMAILQERVESTIERQVREKDALEICREVWWSNTLLRCLCFCLYDQVDGQSTGNRKPSWGIDLQKVIR